MTRFQPILLGSDINVYGMARAFHEEYGLVSEAYAYFQLSPTKFSRIVNVHIVDDFNNFVTFRNFMLKLGKRMKAEDPERVLLLIPCGDVYANLLSQCGDDLREYFVYNTLDVNLSRRLAYKSTFYQICEQYDLPHPKTRTVTADEVKAGTYRDLPFSYPVAMKPANSVEWLNIVFEGRRKAYIFNDPAELETIIKRAYDAGYTSEMVIQDFIPGDDSRMRVLNAYCGLDHKVKLMALGRPLLEEQTPEGIGNYAAILSDPEYNDAALLEKLKNFLEDMQWEGFANMDIKYDARTGEYKMFEMNPRQGRSSYFVTAAGYNLSKWLVEDVLEHKELGLTIADTKSLWMIAPYGVIKKYLKDPDLLARADKLKKEGKCAHQLFCKEDWNLKRWLWYIRSQLNYYRKTARYYGNKGLRD